MFDILPDERSLLLVKLSLNPLVYSSVHIDIWVHLIVSRAQQTVIISISTRAIGKQGVRIARWGRTVDYQSGQGCCCVSSSGSEEVTSLVRYSWGGGGGVSGLTCCRPNYAKSFWLHSPSPYRAET